MEEVIRIQQLSKSFSNHKVLHNFNATIKCGEITCIMGASGAGKTTLLNLILGLSKPDQGQIVGVEGRSMAAVFQEERLCEDFDAIENVKLALSEKISSGRIQEEFKKVSLTDYENKAVRNLSGGMRRRVAIVRALIGNFDIIILDEPLKGFDTDLKTKVLHYIKEVSKNKTVIMVTHDYEEARFLEANIIRL